MASRSLTEVFILMRNNALQSRNIFSDQVSKRDSHTDSGDTMTEHIQVVSRYKLSTPVFCRFRDCQRESFLFLVKHGVICEEGL